MIRREVTLARIAAVGLGGVLCLALGLAAALWRRSVTADERSVASLATVLGERTETMILDARTLLREFEALPYARCSTRHLEALQNAAMSRPHIRAIGYWRAVDRQCGVGFLSGAGLRPPRADRIYDSGVVAWWPSTNTDVGGVQLFLMRFGNHDVAIDPRALLDVGPLEGRSAGLWVEGLRLTSQPLGAALPEPRSLPVGLTIDRGGALAISRFARTSGEMPIDVVAVEPLDQFWSRYRRGVIVGGSLGLVALALWLYLMLRYAKHRMSRATQLRDAIARGRISAQYQPLVSLQTGKCIGAEVLARWTTEQGEAVPPESFVSLAEREGIVTDLTLAVFANAMRDLGDFLRAHPGVSLALNLGSHDLHDDRFAAALAGAATVHQLPPASLKLEITERALVDTDIARRRITYFRAIGHQVAVDDFGTGYSSLAYLSTFELDLLKIDKSFVEAIVTGADTSHVIVHVIVMAQSLGLRMVAEGVETEAQMHWLREHGVEYGQGYLFSKPLSAEDFIAFCARDGVAA